LTPITTIVLFELPPENLDEFVAFWHDIQAFVSKQPGMINGVGHRATAVDGPFQFVNVVRWDSAESLDAALQAVVKEFHNKGTDIGQVFERLDVKQTQSNFTEELRY
jgi:heme-degrading monooxygenase HmoA